ncbi:S49 family peptidase [Aureimonas sp. SK2]|uniref:S49 family peptidase n=1 Tax=Aureimonas sp. SK2 TaxID=3015992 RepID=UPI002443C9C4|nr:S49 family peptidase [Aureimonas sp. SK2]
MKYARILLAVASEIWAMQPEKLEAMIAFLALQAEGAKFDAAEIEARISPQMSSDVARREGAVAILPLRGVVANRMNMFSSISGGTSNEAFGAAMREAVADDRVNAIVLDVDSPGGTVQGTEELSSLIHSLRGQKPIVAQVNATAASAAYWIASAADEVVMTPTGWVGSIGAMTVHDDISAALERAGVKRTVIKSAEGKNEAPPHLPLSDEARAQLEAQCAFFDKMFVDRVASNRGVSTAVVRSDFGKGRMVIGADAVRAGMADRIATMDETLARFGAGHASPPPRAAASTPRRHRAIAAL